MLRQEHTAMKGSSLDAANRLLQSRNVRGTALEIVAEMERGNAAEFGLKVRKGDNQETTIGVDVKESTLFVDRGRSSEYAMDQRFPARNSGPIVLMDGKNIQLHILVDRSSVEVFGNNGETVLSEVIFPKLSADGIELYSNDGEARILSMDVWNLKSVYQ
jgi:fructan beta-fructosidase